MGHYSRRMARWHRVPLAALGDARRAVVQVDGREIAIFRVGEAVYAVDNRCPHEGNPLIEGDIAGDTLTCAYHLWRFDLATGACLSGDEPTRPYPVHLEGDEIRIELE
jgi:nitrite reductase/ring-hydroxylating ferredoxin subunit